MTDFKYLRDIVARLPSKSSGTVIIIPNSFFYDKITYEENLQFKFVNCEIYHPIYSTASWDILDDPSNFKLDDDDDDDEDDWEYSVLEYPIHFPKFARKLCTVGTFSNRKFEYDDDWVENGIHCIGKTRYNILVIINISTTNKTEASILKKKYYGGHIMIIHDKGYNFDKRKISVKAKYNIKYDENAEKFILWVD